MTEIADTPMDTELRCYDVVLVTSEGEQSTIRCDSRTTVLEAAEGSGLVLKSACQAGGCGACSAVLSDGRGGDGRPRPRRHRDARGGWRNPVVPQLPAC